MTEPEDPATSAAANDELWLTYLNYDRAVQQAVNRLSALSSDNVDMFRTLLLKGRDRARVKEYEAESIRRLQGEAFVGDDELQRTLIVLNAENVRLGDELKRVIAAAGRPEDLEQTVAAIRSRQAPPERTLERIPGQADVAVPAPVSVPAEVIPLYPSPVQTETKERAESEEPPRKPWIAPPPTSEPTPAPAPIRTPVPMPAPVSAKASASEPVSSGLSEAQPTTQPSRPKRLAMFGAIFLVAAVGLAFLFSHFGSGDTPKVSTVQVAPPPLRVAAEDRRTATAAPVPAAETAPQLQSEKPSPAPAPAASPAESSSSQDATPEVAPEPVPGSHYKVVRGDMLSVIALRAYKDASKFTLIQQANPNLRNGPDRIYYDQVIFIPPAP